MIPLRLVSHLENGGEFFYFRNWLGSQADKAITIVKRRKYLTNYGLLKYFVWRSQARSKNKVTPIKRKIFLNKKTTGMYSTSEIKKRLNISYVRLHQYRNIALKKYPELTLFEGVDFFYDKGKIIYNDSALKKLEQRLQLKGANPDKSIYTKSA